MSDNAAPPILNEPLYTLDEVAAALGMSTRWVREECKKGAEHHKFGHKYKFSTSQVESLRDSKVRAGTVPDVVESITTGRKKKSA